MGGGKRKKQEREEVEFHGVCMRVVIAKNVMES